MTHVEIVPAVTAATALAALGLSFFNTIEQRRAKRPTLDVSLSYGLVNGPRVQSALLLRVGNRGAADVSVVGCGLRVPGPKTVVFTRTREIPKRLAAGDGIIEYQELEPFLADLGEKGLRGRVPAYGFVNDATGREHRARKPLLLEIPDPGRAC